MQTPPTILFFGAHDMNESRIAIIPILHLRRDDDDSDIISNNQVNTPPTPQTERPQICGILISLSLEQLVHTI